MAAVLTNAGKTFLLSSLVNNIFPTLYVGWGTGAGTSSAGDTTLFSEDTAGSPPYNRIGCTITLITTNTPNDTLQIQGTIQSNGTKTITNAGVFSALSGGTLIWHSDFAGDGVNSGDSIAFTYDFIL